MILHGKYSKGIGRASRFGEVYRPAFGCPMVATFNVHADGPITRANPTKAINLTWPEEKPKTVTFWLCRINECWAWAMRWEGSKLPEDRLEFVSKHPLPERLKQEYLTIEVFERWPDAQIDDWASKNYQWQGFSWLPRQRVDSRSVWEVIAPHGNWSGADVLDVGSHYGYHSFQASRAGACVVAIEPDDDVRTKAEIIAWYIEMQDVEFRKSLYPQTDPVDIILYLSVHHQWDPDYRKLGEKIGELATHAKQAVFVELILPPMFGRSYTAKGIDDMVGGNTLKTYKHRIRGIRRIYKVEGKA